MYCRWRMEALSAGHRDNKMNKPLTDEQIWGVPAEQLPKQEQIQIDFFEFVDIYGESIACRFFGIEISGEVKDGSSEEEKKEQS